MDRRFERHCPRCEQPLALACAADGAPFRAVFVCTEIYCDYAESLAELARREPAADSTIILRPAC